METSGLHIKNQWGTCTVKQLPFSFFLTLILNAVYWAPSIQHQVAFTLPENHNFYYSIIQLHIHIYLTWLYTSSNLASAKATFWEHIGDGAERTIISQQNNNLLTIYFPCSNNNAQNGASNLTTSILTNHSNFFHPPLHDNRYTNMQRKLRTFAGKKGFTQTEETARYLQ